MLLELPVKTSVPTRGQLWVRQLKVAGLSARRLLLWQLYTRRWPRSHLATTTGYPHLVYQARIPIARRDPDAHPVLEAGKLHNLALAAPAFDGLELAPGRVVSFWRTLGRVTAEGGYRAGMELRGGCIVPSLGGGLCLLSNALFEMGARLGLGIVERHGHTVEAVPDLSALWGLDATLFWPYVDLCLRPTFAGRLEVKVEDGMLLIAVRSRSPWETRVELRAVDDREEGRVRTNRILRTVDGVEEVIAVNRKRLTHSVQRRRNCLTCGELGCSARAALISLVPGGATAPPPGPPRAVAQ